MTNTLAGGTVPAAVMNMGKNLARCSAADSPARYPATVAWDERASMDCARLIRGSRSSLYTVAPRAARACTVSAAATGWRKLISETPSGNAPTSSSVGGCTRATTAAPERAAAASSTTVAPAWRKASSENRARSPAPDSTTTSTPVLASLVATSGTIATRSSPGRDSLMTASFTA